MNNHYEHSLGPGNRVRFRKDALVSYKPHVVELLSSLRGTIAETDDEARECDYHLVKWDDPNLNFEEIFNQTAPLYLELDEFVQGDDLEPLPEEEDL